MAETNGYEIASLKTTSNTATLLWSHTLSNPTAATVRATIVAMKSDGTARAMFKRECHVYNGGSGATALGDAWVSIPDSNAPGWACAFQLSGNDLQLNVTGAASTTIQWRARIEVLTA